MRWPERWVRAVVSFRTRERSWLDERGNFGALLCESNGLKQSVLICIKPSDCLIRTQQRGGTVPSGGGRQGIPEYKDGT